MQFVPLFLGGVKALGSIVSGAEESQNLKAQQQAAQLSAQYARDNATNELRISTADADAQRRRGREKVAEQFTGFAQSGFGVTDSATQAVDESQANSELDALNIQYKGTLRNRADLIEAGNYDAQADAARRARKTVPFKTAIGVATNLLSGYAQGSGMKIS